MISSEYYTLEVDTEEETLERVPTVTAEALACHRTGLKGTGNTVKAKGGSALRDHVFVIGSTPLLLSARAYECIRPLRLCPSIQWYALQLKWRRLTYPYHVGEFTNVHDIWDYERSDYTLLYDDRPRGKLNMGNLRRGVVNPQLLPPLDLFRAEYNGWVGSEAFKRKWNAAGLDGMMFTKLETGLALRIADAIRRMRLEWSSPRAVVYRTPRSSEMKCVCTFSRTAATAEEIGRWPPADLRDFWRVAEAARLYEDVTHGRRGLEIVTPNEALETMRTMINERPRDFREGDVIVGRFLGSFDRLIVRCDVTHGDFAHVLVALAHYPRQKWPIVGLSFTDFINKYMNAEGKRYWEDSAQS